VVRRFAPCVAAAAIGWLTLFVFSATAVAGPSQPTFTETHPQLFSATSSSGTTLQIDVVLDFGLLSRAQGPPGLPPLSVGETYFEVRLQVAPSDAPDLPIVLPVGAASLRAGASGPFVTASTGSTDSDWYFPVARSTKFGVLTIATASLTVPILGPGGQVTNTLAHPATLALVLPRVAPASASATSPGRPAARHGHSGAEAALFAAGALVVVGAGFGLLAFGRRRAFYRADREGRLVLVAPPVIAGALEAPAPEVRPRRAPKRIVVKILGWLEITRVKRRSEHAVAASGPVSEIVVFLVLNPGCTFTSIQLREAIWGLGRSPLSSTSFRNYMVELRKTFGSGVVVTRSYKYELTAAVVSDLAMFRAALSRDEPVAGPEEALSLVRGPVLNGCFDSKKNSPFAWAVGVANDIEDEVTSVAHDLAVASLAAQEPARAAWALAQGLLCSTTNLRLRLLELEVGCALGGAQELERRLSAGQAALARFPQDVARLEEAARQLGGDAQLM
jgi:uncharacterized Zn-binding protein involved in type VI secretion